MSGRWPENWYRDVWLIAITGLVVWSLASFASDRSHRAKASAESQLQNCQQIESVKGQIRAVIQDSAADVRRLPEPRRSQAEAQVHAVLVRFAPRDCYLLPIVQSVGLKRP